MKIFLSLAERISLVRKNMFPGESVYGEKKVSTSEGDDKIEYQA
jgi:rRNA 2'-O-methyltransferase fibrillarin